MVGCRDSFTPPVTADQVSFLTVDGVMDATNGKATIKLSRAVKLSSSSSFPVIPDAVVSIEDQNNNSISIPYADSGIYRLSGILFNSENKYRLRIQQSDGRRYSSELMPILPVPEIDSLFWEGTPDGLKIEINTKTDNTASRYYKWTAIETWQYTAPLESILVIDQNQNTSIRLPEDQIYNCWTTQPSSDILIQSANLSSDNRIDKFQLAFLPVGTPKLNIGYSLLVKQMSLSEETYQFWDQLKKTTQNVGGLFDPLPSKLVGNIHNDADPSENVLGFFYGGYTRTQRMMIHYNDLPYNLQTHSASTEVCSTFAIRFANLASRDPKLVIVTSFGIPTQGYIFSFAGCVDCRKGGGTNKKPSFWN